MKTLKTLLALTLILLIGINITAAAPKQAELTPGGEKSKIIHIGEDNGAKLYLLEKQVEETLPEYKETKNWNLTVIHAKPKPGKVHTDPNLTKYRNIEKEKVWAEAICFVYNTKTNIVTLNNFTYYNEKGQIIADASEDIKNIPPEQRSFLLQENDKLIDFFAQITAYLDSKLK
ncbi:hypothetical protein LJC10_05820 [Selenomonadales bacterium OttesenSCG-928-I06]|nr:hypothetical protein [Selenomonadales bacterium OttesenSCG-928-I06]